MTHDNQGDLLDAVAGICLRCFLLSMAVLLLWFALLTLCGDWVYTWHSKFSGITRAQFNVVHYAGMALLKMGAFVFFLFPFLSIKMMQGRMRRGA